MTQLALFYDALDTETRIVVQQRTIEIKALMKRAASDIIEIGQKLIEVKAKLDHGHFYTWLDAEFDWTPMTANRFMHVANRFKSNNLLDSFAPSALYLLAAPSTPESAREEAIERAEHGETIAHATAQEILGNHRPPRQIAIVPTLENQDLIGDGVDDVWDPPMEPAQVADLEAGRITGRISYDPPTAQPRINAGLLTSTTPEWYTPDKILDLVRKVLGQIDLDPCSNSCDPDTANVPALHYYTAHDNGLDQRWFGKVYMNPPYGDEIGAWVEKLVRSFKDKEITEGIALLPARTDTAWIQPLYDYALCFVRGRLKFSGAENSAPFPSLLVYLGPDNDLFMDCFEQIGRTGRLQ